MPVCLEALLHVVWVEAESLHLSEDVLVDGDFVEADDDAFCVFVVLAIHPGMAADLVNIVPFGLVAVEHLGNEVFGWF